MKLTATDHHNGQAKSEMNIPGLATRYQVGVRTIENWLAWGIIPGRMEHHKIVADVDECDRRLKAYKNSKA